jgi:N-methylhydantoinase A
MSLNLSPGLSGQDTAAVAARSGVAIGVDTGGTHTDLVLADNGRLLTLKVPSTTDDLTTGILEGVVKLAEQAGVPLSRVERFVYASTFVTNLFIEGKQAPVGLITTQGFRDVLEIGRASRKPDVYDIHWRPAKPLVPRHLRLGVKERIDHRGGVLVELDEVSVRAALEVLAAAGVGSIAVCLLHAYANPAHERRVAEIAAELCPSIDISLSSDVVREFREYERTSTTCINAFIKAPIGRHLQSLAAALRERGVPAEPAIMQGNGGISRFETASQAPTSITHSGVMGGIVGAAALAARSGIRDLITLDMGGTSADVSLIAAGQPTLSHRSAIGPYPLLAPTLDMITIGAGGGSIAWIDGGTALRVGPRSAGSTPGPACYGQGGQAATVTDANLVTGRLNGDYFLAGARRLDLALARQAVAAIAEPLGMSQEEAALGIIAIAEAHMANAIRLVSVERGLDPRDFTLVAFGGAGALHAARLAEALAIREILIPPAPGNLSAMGLLCSDTRHDHARTLFSRLTPELAVTLDATVDELLQEAGRSLAADGIEDAAHRFTVSVDLRYEGQNYELSLPIDQAEIAAAADTGFLRLTERFDEAHLRVYGYRLEGRAIQLVNVRVTAVGATAHADWPRVPALATSSSELPVPHARRPVLIEAGRLEQADVFRHAELLAGQRFEAPSIVEYAGGTLFVPPGWRGRVDEFANVHLSRTAAHGIDTDTHAAEAGEEITV